MEESNISNDSKDIQTIDNYKLFIHLIKPEFIPVGNEFKYINELDSIVDGSCSEIIINDLLDYLLYNDSGAILDKLLLKLTDGGSISVQSIDLYQFASAITFEDIDLDTTKMILYPHKKAIYTMYDIETEMKNRNLSIIEKKYINVFEYYIKAQKI